LRLRGCLPEVQHARADARWCQSIHEMCVMQTSTEHTAFSWNYVSVGMDAQAAYGFHELRESKPRLAASRAANQFWYGYFSCASGWFCGSGPLKRKVRTAVLLFFFSS
jgi:Diacylglycerol kinase accessory domain